MTQDADQIRRRWPESHDSHGTPTSAKSLDINAVISTISRRQFLAIARTSGFSATVLALAGTHGPFSTTALARKAAKIGERRRKTKPRHTLRFATGYGTNHLQYLRAGVVEFIRDIETRSDGAIRVELIDSGTLCGGARCVYEAMRGAVDIATAPTQAASAVAPWLNALDFPFVFPSRGQVYNFLYDPASERLLRKTYRRTHRLEFLFALAEMRDLFVGPVWKEKPAISSLTQLAGSRIRVSNSQLARITLELLGMRPVPLSWRQTAPGLKSGAIAGLESWTSAVTAFGMVPSVGQIVKLSFQPALVHTAMRTRSFDALGSALQDNVLESAYQTQIIVQRTGEAALATLSGTGSAPAKGTVLAKNRIKIRALSSAAMRQARQTANPRDAAFKAWHSRLNRLAGFAVHDEIHAAVQTYASDTPAIDVVPRRWWRTT